MNENIKNLIKNVSTDTSGRWVSVEELEKFAELIVQECCDIADQVERADMDSYVSKYIRAHFGVEE
jgi:hypothetical protein